MFSYATSECFYGVPYGSAQLTETSPPQSFSEPLTLTEVKAWLNIEQASPPNDEDDELLLSLIPAAREVAEMFQGRDLVRKQIDLVFDHWPATMIELGAPLVSVDLIRYRDSSGSYTTLTEETDFIVDIYKQPGIVTPAYGRSWPSFTPWPSSAVLIRFTSGYSITSAFWSDAGSRLKKGMLHLAADWYEERLSFNPGQSTDLYPLKIRALLGSRSRPRVK